MRSTYITATVIAIVIIAWLLSGQLGKDDTLYDASLAEQNREQAAVSSDAAPTRVRVAVQQATEQTRTLKVRGQTENKRTVDVKVELSGKVVARPVERGSVVAANDLLCQISVEDRQVAVVEAREALNQAQLEYQGALSLKKRGFNSDTAIAAAKARLASAQANISRRKLDLQKISVRAPFAGMVEDIALEVGDFVTSGASCATVVDLNPMLLRGRVSEQQVADLKLDQRAIGILRTGELVQGPVTFIGQLSDPATRTYPIEIQIANDNHSVRSGITTEIRIPVESVLAQKVSPALFGLDDSGNLGVKTIDENNIVEFHEIAILQDTVDGAWVTGLPNRAAVIVVGQELVAPGERVDPVFQGNSTMPAKSEDPTAPASSAIPNTAAASSVMASVTPAAAN